MPLLVAKVPGRWQGLVGRSCEPEPGDRYQTDGCVAEVERALEPRQFRHAGWRLEYAGNRSWSEHDQRFRDLRTKHRTMVARAKAPRRVAPS